MHLWQAKGYIGLFSAAKLHQLAGCSGIIKVGKTFADKFAFRFYARRLIKIVIGAKIVFTQQQIHLFTAFAAKWFAVHFNNVVALLAAMKANYRYSCSCFDIIVF